MGTQEDLNSDELGEKGESRFKEICADSKLVCNRSDRDRTGWDFIVEFPFKSQANSTFDSRSAPISCHVQVKTILQTSKNFKMRLTAAERLAKESKPAFVYVFKVDKKLQFVDAYLVNIIDDRLGAILKRLRKEQADGTPENKLNAKYISMSLNKREQIAITGCDLRSKLELLICDGMHSYMAVKKKQLETLGFNLRPYHGKMSLHIKSIDEAVDVFLGIKRDIPVSNFNVVQNRFDIDLPHVAAADGKISINPAPVEQCTISFFHDGSYPPAVFSGDVFVPAIPSLPKDKFKALIKTALFSFTLQPEGEKTITFSFTYDVNNKNESIQTWIHFWSMMFLLSSGNGEIRISTPRMADINLSLNKKLPTGETTENCNLWFDLCEKTSKLFVKAGVPLLQKLTIGELKSVWGAVHLANTFTNGEPINASFSSDKASITDLSDMKVIFGDLIKFNEIGIAYYGVMIFHPEVMGEDVLWKSIEYSMGRIQAIGSQPEKFNEFIEAAQQKENTSNFFRPDTSTMLA